MTSTRTIQTIRAIPTESAPSVAQVERTKDTAQVKAGALHNNICDHFDPRACRRENVKGVEFRRQARRVPAVVPKKAGSIDQASNGTSPQAKDVAPAIDPSNVDIPAVNAIKTVTPTNAVRPRGLAVPVAKGAAPAMSSAALASKSRAEWRAYRRKLSDGSESIEDDYLETMPVMKKQKKAKAERNSEPKRKPTALDKIKKLPPSNSYLYGTHNKACVFAGFLPPPTPMIDLTEPQAQPKSATAPTDISMQKGKKRSASDDSDEHVAEPAAKKMKPTSTFFREFKPRSGRT